MKNMDFVLFATLFGCLLVCRARVLLLLSSVDGAITGTTNFSFISRVVLREGQDEAIFALSDAFLDSSLSGNDQTLLPVSSESHRSALLFSSLSSLIRASLQYLTGVSESLEWPQPM
jgi:hypothetical protein